MDYGDFIDFDVISKCIYNDCRSFIIEDIHCEIEGNLESKTTKIEN